MSVKVGRLTTCDRCGQTVFCKVVGTGETDGGYNKWNEYEDYPEGWIHSCVFDRYYHFCPSCGSEAKSIFYTFIGGNET